MKWYEAEVQALERHLRGRRRPTQPTVFYGSSSIRLWSDLATDLRDSRAVNLGFGGATLAACAHYFQRLVLPLQPASLVAYAGDNDLGDGRSPAEVLNSYRALADLVDAFLPWVPFGFVSIKLSPARTRIRMQIEQANRLIRTEISKRSQAYYIEVFHDMLDDAGGPRRELFLEDGLHLSRAGYRLWAHLLEPHRHRIFIPPSPGSHTRGLSSFADEA